MNRAGLSIILSFIILCWTPAAGQITQEKLDSLRAVGQQKGWTFKMELNEATQYPLEQLCGSRMYDEPPTNVTDFSTLLSATTLEYPARFDWRELGGVTPIRNQGGCGSCWAFGTVGSLECNLKIRDNVVWDLSEQYLVSCNTYGYSCGGGEWAHDFHLSWLNPYYETDPCGGWGPVLEATLPYAGVDNPCSCPYVHQHDLAIDSWSYVSPATITNMKHAILMYGPIGVYVYVNDPWYLYSGGVFNACESDLGINHAVVLVGWDDNLGSEGCWILRNSWGAGWGEDGYMYIEYGCSNVGSGACFVDIGIPPVMYFYGDTLIGSPPITVNFDAFYPEVVDTWTWDFDDGGYADIQKPTHVFEQRGAFDVSLEIVSGGEIHVLTREDYIIAIADTLMTTDIYGQPGDTVVMTISTFNSAPVEYFKIPVEFPNDFNLTYLGFSTAGCRTEYFERQDYLHYDLWYKRFTLRLQSSQSDTSPALPPGEGAIVKLYFTIPGAALEGKIAPIYLDGYTVTTTTYLPTYLGDIIDYEVPTIGGSITVSQYCCVMGGDATHNGAVDIDDIIYLVDWNFASGPQPSCLDEVEIDGAPPFTIEDLVYLVNYVYNGGPAPAGCP
ncbi:MAG: C1 family peptidase [Candidatus Zixiibacteriota bacterium]